MKSFPNVRQLEPNVGLIGGGVVLGTIIVSEDVLLEISIFGQHPYVLSTRGMKQFAFWKSSTEKNIGFLNLHTGDNLMSKFFSTKFSCF